jgi:hypothetical protein
MKVTQIGVTLIETTGTEQKPYKIFQADVLECPICEGRMIFTDARPTHASMCNDFTFQGIVNVARSKNELYLSHEFPAGDDFKRKYFQKEK